MIQSEKLKQDKKEEKQKRRTIIINYDISCKALLYLLVCMMLVFITSIFLV
jgi:hypothetical protein